MADYTLTIPTGNGAMPTVTFPTSKTVDIKTASGSTTFTFTGTAGSCFTDGTTSFSIDTTGVTKTTLAQDSPGHTFSAGSRTGDINIGEDR